MSANGGITKGKSHKEGGIPMVVKSTGQQVELEGGEGVINKRNMASDKKFEFQGKQMTTCEIASEINSANGNGVQIECDDVTGKKYEYSTGGKILNEDEEESFKEWMDDGNVIEQSKGVYSTQDAQYRNRLKGLDELRKYFRKEFLSDSYEGGGGVEDYVNIDKMNPRQYQVVTNFNTLKSLAKNGFIVLHEKTGLRYKNYESKDRFRDNRVTNVRHDYIESSKSPKFEFKNKKYAIGYEKGLNFLKLYVLEDMSKSENKYEGGGGVGNVYIALSKTKNGLLLSERFDKQITHKQLFDYYKKKGYEIIDSNIFKVTNKDVLDVYKDAISKFIEEKYNELVDWENTFLSYEIVGDRIIAQSCFVQTQNGKEYKITPNDLVNKKFAEGGGIKDFNSLIGKYVNIYSMGVSLPTEHQIKDVQVSGENFRHRYVTLKFDLGIAPILLDEATAFMNNEIIYVNNNKEEFGIQLMPNQFEQGGDVRDFSWYQDFKKEQLKKGTEHEMEHVDSIKKFKKKGVSDKEVAQAIAKDHLEEDENYYIELDKMEESSREVAKALNHHEKNKTRRKNIKKFNLGGYTGSQGELIYIKMKEDVTTDLFSLEGKFYSETTFRKDAVVLMHFISNNGYSTKLEMYDTGVYAIIPNVAFQVVGYDSSKFGMGGGVKAPFNSLSLSDNDKKILSLLRTLDENNATHQHRVFISNFRGDNVVNQLSKQVITKIYSLLFEWHNIQNPIHNILIENVGTGNLASLLPTSILNQISIQFDKSNPYFDIEKKICGIVNNSITFHDFTSYDIQYLDAIVKVYGETNPKHDTLVKHLFATQKKAIILGVAEFTSLKDLEDFKVTISINTGNFALNQMFLPESMKYFVVNEGITDNAKHTLIYGVTKY